MKNRAHKGLVTEREIERYCLSTVKLLIKIHERTDEAQSKKQQKKKKPTALLVPE